jgi:hypothetical protein
MIMSIRSILYRVDKKNVSKFKLQYLNNAALYLVKISHTITTGCYLHSM